MSINNRRTSWFWRQRRWLWSAGDISDLVAEACYLMLRFLKTVIVVSIFLLLPLEGVVRMILCTNTDCTTAVALPQTQIVEDVCTISPQQQQEPIHQQQQQDLHNANHDWQQQGPLQPKPSHIVAMSYFSYRSNPALQFLNALVHDYRLLFGGKRHWNENLENTLIPPDPTSPPLAAPTHVDGQKQIHPNENGGINTSDNGILGSRNHRRFPLVQNTLGRLYLPSHLLKALHHINKVRGDNL